MNGYLGTPEQDIERVARANNVVGTNGDISHWGECRGDARKQVIAELLQERIRISCTPGDEALDRGRLLGAR